MAAEGVSDGEVKEPAVAKQLPTRPQGRASTICGPTGHGHNVPTEARVRPLLLRHRELQELPPGYSRAWRRETVRGFATDRPHRRECVREDQSDRRAPAAVHHRQRSPSRCHPPRPHRCRPARGPLAACSVMAPDALPTYPRLSVAGDRPRPGCPSATPNPAAGPPLVEADWNRRHVVGNAAPDAVGVNLVEAGHYRLQAACSRRDEACPCPCLGMQRTIRGAIR